MNLKQMQDYLYKDGIEVTDEMLNQFQKYLTLLMEWNEKINLTALKTEEEIIEKHFYDSLLVAKQFKFEEQSLIDVGTGAGFPGIPLKIVFPDLFVTLLEPTEKRVNFLNIVIKELSLTRIVTVNKRAEDYVKEARSFYDIVTARAVSRLNMLVELCLPLIHVGGTFIALKGKQGQEEIEEAKNGLKILNSHVETIQTTNLISENDNRINIFIKKDNEFPVKYPRPYGQIKKKPL